MVVGAADDRVGVMVGVPVGAFVVVIALLVVGTGDVGEMLVVGTLVS